MNCLDRRRSSRNDASTPKGIHVPLLTAENRPHQGKGGTQAVEDAQGFRLFLEPGIMREDVPEILKDFDSVRRPRACQIQENARKAVERRTAEDVYRLEKYNWTYPGIVEGLRRVKSKRRADTISCAQMICAR
jgi:hypothetical protein